MGQNFTPGRGQVGAKVETQDSRQRAKVSCQISHSFHAIFHASFHATGESCFRAPSSLFHATIPQGFPGAAREPPPPCRTTSRGSRTHYGTSVGSLRGVLGSPMARMDPSALEGARKGPFRALGGSLRGRRPFKGPLNGPCKGHEGVEPLRGPHGALRDTLGGDKGPRRSPAGPLSRLV